MSPEQARSEELDPRTDLFSFGVVLYEMATGKKPFTGNNVIMTLDAVLHTKPPSPSTLNPTLPKELEAIIGKAMEKDRNKRYANAAEMKADLQHLKKETESGLTRTSGRETSPMRLASKTFQSSSKPQSYLLIAVSCFAAHGAGGGWNLVYQSIAPEISRRPRIRSRCCHCRISTATSAWTISAMRWPMKLPIRSPIRAPSTFALPTVTRKYVGADLDLQKVGTRASCRQRTDRTL